MDDNSIREYLYNAIQEHFVQNVFPEAKNTVQFLEWAREQIAERSSNV